MANGDKQKILARLSTQSITVQTLPFQQMVVHYSFIQTKVVAISIFVNASRTVNSDLQYHYQVLSTHHLKRSQSRYLKMNAHYISPVTDPEVMAV